jgi:AraC-like DNA-binding protein
VRISLHLNNFLIGVIDASWRHYVAKITLRMRKVIRLIEGLPEQRLSVSTMAKHVGLSVPRLKRRFRDEVGMPPAEYAIRFRVTEAKRQLVIKRYSVTAIAHEFGFCSSQHFAAVFRRYTGLTPTAYAAGRAVHQSSRLGRATEIVI